MLVYGGTKARCWMEVRKVFGVDNLTVLPEDSVTVYGDEKWRVSLESG